MSQSVVANDFSLFTGEKNKWKVLVSSAIESNQLRGSTCPAYSPTMVAKSKKENEMCRCGHLLRYHDLEHVFESEGTERTKAQLNTFVQMPLENCGSLGNNVRVCHSFEKLAKRTESILQSYTSNDSFDQIEFVFFLVHPMFSRLAEYT